MEELRKEKKELDKKIAELRMFLGSEDYFKAHQESSILEEQLKTMEQYSDMLLMRIKQIYRENEVAAYRNLDKLMMQEETK